LTASCDQAAHTPIGVALVHLPRSLVVLFPAAPRRLTVEAASVGELIDRLDESWPGMRDRLCDVGPEIREYVHVYVNGERASLQTPLPDGSTVHIIPAIAGG
jgi:molybdopterin synthase sulfur carrier subunit